LIGEETESGASASKSMPPRPNLWANLDSARGGHAGSLPQLPSHRAKRLRLSDFASNCTERCQQNGTLRRDLILTRRRFAPSTWTFARPQSPPSSEHRRRSACLPHAYFQVGSAQVAFDALAPLASGLDMTKEDLLDGRSWTRRLASERRIRLEQEGQPHAQDLEKHPGRLNISDGAWLWR